MSALIDSKGWWDVGELIISIFPPSDVIRQLLIDLGIGSESSNWPIFVSFFPDTPDNAICVYDTAGILDGRLMRSGVQIVHPGIQVQVRGSDYIATESKVWEIALGLDAQKKSVVDVEGNNHIIHNISRNSPFHLGIQESADRRRHLYSLNALVTLNRE